MIKKIVLPFLALAALSAQGATIKLSGGNVSYSEETPFGTMGTRFMKSMANQLYTFYNVTLDGVEVNSTASSNNIGGFQVNGWWTGGNHNDGTPNSYTVDVRLVVDGNPIENDGTYTGKVLTVEVKNELFYNDKVKFCDEFITYKVSGNSMEIWGEHHYTYPSPLSIWVYYPMQSVFIDETEILTPGGKCRLWTPLVVTSEGNEVQFTRASAPNFCTFVEHSAKGYQATYLMREGIGNREWVRPSDYVFIGNSWGKNYHKCIGYHDVVNGDISTWHGLYSWFKEPIIDNCRNASQDLTFSYGAYIDGEPVTMQLSMSGQMNQLSGIETAPVADASDDFAVAGPGFIEVFGNAPDARCYDVSGQLVHVGAGSFSCNAGVYIVNNMQGDSVKLYVK